MNLTANEYIFTEILRRNIANTGNFLEKNSSFAGTDEFRKIEFDIIEQRRYLRKLKEVK